jgi:predicted glycosyltransferase
VINSSAGKLTQINAVRVQGPLTALSVTTVSEGRISSEQLHEHALIAAMQQPELTKARCIVNGPNLAQAKAQAERLCALVRASNKNIETTVVESRSTVKNNSVFARVIYGWN